MDVENQRTLLALRNFFLARSGKELAEACATLADTEVMTPDATDFDDRYWQEAEFAFNRLFVGPAALQAPPYASCYLEPEQQLMGKSTLKVRRLYEMAGLVSSLQGLLPDDHLGVELDAALGLQALAERFDEEEPRALWRYFLREHLSSWVPLFLDQARNAETGHPAVNLALDRLETWLKDEGIKEKGYDQ
jgi:TorA maturation chaperone TorD